MKKFLFALLISTGFGFSQPIPQPQPPSIAYQPQLFVAAGASYDYYGKTGFAAQTTFGVKATTSTSSLPFYSITTLELTQQIATLRTGVGYIFLQRGNWSVIGLGDAGLSTGGTSTALGSFSGGGFLSYDIGSRITKGNSHWHIAVGGRILNITSQTVQPIFTVAFGPSF